MRGLIVFALVFASGCSTYGSKGLDALNAGRNQEAADYFVRCADQGYAYCMHNLGYMFSSGKIRDQDPRRQAIGWFTLAARNGYEPSRVALVQLGAPVPPPDLVREATPEELEAAGLVGQAIGTAIGGGFRRR
jgi:TPR repeat protein